MQRCIASPCIDGYLQPTRLRRRESTGWVAPVDSAADVLRPVPAGKDYGLNPVTL
jgi:hypothetical protein